VAVAVRMRTDMEVVIVLEPWVTGKGSEAEEVQIEPAVLKVGRTMKSTCPG
jgi:hypothetical protein